MSRQRQPIAVKSLKGVLKRWAVALLAHVTPHFNDVVGANADDLRIEGTMVDSAHGNAIRDDWLSTFGVFSDVCGVKQFGMVSKPTKRTAGIVCDEDALTEHPLVQASANRRLRVLTAEREIDRVNQNRVRPLSTHLGVNGDDELMALRLLSHQPDWIHRRVDALSNSEEPYEGLRQLQSASERHIVVVVEFLASPFVPEVPVRTLGILVRSVVRPSAECRQDAEGALETRDDADTAHPLDERDTSTLELEGLQILIGDLIARPPREFVQVCERGRAETFVEVARHECGV